jgi:hypothetical protein
MNRLFREQKPVRLLPRFVLLEPNLKVMAA